MKTLVPLLLFFFCFSLLSNAQNFYKENYPQNYFRNPLNIPLQLSANFGEIRKDHFHMGLDIRTDKKENLPVFAAADGYITRVKIERFGYGRVIYIQHPNGLTTLYAHLNNFYDTLNNYVKSIQYKEQKWEQDIGFAEDAFPIKKGQFIAYSGNTGGSQGPHLHYEIRENFEDTLHKDAYGRSDVWERNINPLLFNLGIADNIAPRIDGLYWYDRRYSTYETSTNNIELIKTKEGITSKDSIVEIGTTNISFGISAEDRTNNSPYYFGIYSAHVFMDSILQDAFELNSIRTNYTSFVNGCIDYPYLIRHKKNIQHISSISRNLLYSWLAPQELFADNLTYKLYDLKDTLVHKMRIDVKDIVGNTSTINFLLRYNPSIQKDSVIQRTKYDPYIFFGVYYPELKTDSTVSKNRVVGNGYSILDAVQVAVTQKKRKGFPYASNLITIGDYAIPVYEPYAASILLDSIAAKYPNKLILQAKSPVAHQTKKIDITSQIFGYSNSDKKDTCMVASTSLKMFGDVQVLIDTIAPIIQPINFSKSSLFNIENEIIFKIKDDLTEIKKFSAELDGNWLMFARKDDYYIYTFDEHCTLGTHILKITAEDEAGNIAEHIFPFTKELPKLNKSKKKLLVKKKNTTSQKKKKKKR